MAAIVAATMEDVNAKYLIGKFQEIIQETAKPNAEAKKKDGITSTYYESSTAKLLLEVTGFFNYLIGEIDPLKQRVSSLEEKDKKKDEKIKTLEDENKMLKKNLVNKCLEFERSQQYQNRDTFKLCGIKEPELPPNQYEDTAETVIKALDSASVPLKKEEISASYRVPGKDGSRPGPKNILIKTGLHNTKDRIMRNKKLLRLNKDFQKAYPDAYIVEQLTPLRSKVAYMLRHDDTVENAWTINGRIRVTFKGADENTKPKSIDSLSQLKQVMKWTDEQLEKLVLEQQ